SLVATGTDAKNWALHSTGPGNVQGAGHLLFWDWTTNVERMRIDKLGDVGIGLTANPGTYRLYVGGSGYYSGGLFVASDRRFKTNIRTLDGALGTVMRLRGVQYDYRQAEFAERNFPGGKTDGYVAQELREVMPELVQEGPDGYLAVNYLGVIPVLSEAVKELKTEKDEEIEALEARVAEQDKQIDELEARLARLEAALERAAPQAEPTRVQMSNQPNPFNGITTINCTIPANVRSAELVVTDMSGREITRRTVAERGPVNVEMNLSAAPSGTYVCTLQADGKIAGSVKMMLNGK
ncbi:MAG TPA: tail fiber domain-containing protein, partial [Saprospiraceae bacterium]|nr:tail fiber domain-containing protein [Saprospiraceae bacterium]